MDLQSFDWHKHVPFSFVSEREVGQKQNKLGEEGDTAHLSGLKADGLESSKRQVVPVGELSESTDNAAKQRKYSKDALQLDTSVKRERLKMYISSPDSEDETENLHMKTNSCHIIIDNISPFVLISVSDGSWWLRHLF